MAILFSRLIAFVECCVAVPANRIGSKTMTLEQGIRYLSREGEVRHHGQTENSRQAADFSRKRSANLKARNRAAAPRTWSGATGSLRIEPSDGLTLPGFAALYWMQSITSGWSPVLRTARLPAGATRTTEPSFTGMFTPSTWYSPLPEPLS